MPETTETTIELTPEQKFRKIMAPKVKTILSKFTEMNNQARKKGLDYSSADAMLDVIQESLDATREELAKKPITSANDVVVDW